jgi:hypothetical protein
MGRFYIGKDKKVYFPIIVGDHARGDLIEEPRCHLCRSIEGQPHGHDCDAEICPVCGCSLVECDCIFSLVEYINEELSYDEMLSLRDILLTRIAEERDLSTHKLDVDKQQ